MTGFRARASMLAAASACALLAACGDAAPDRSADKAAAAKPTGPKPAVAGAQMVAAVAAAKTATAVGVHFSLGNSPRVGTALPVEIVVIPHENFTSLQAHFGSQQGLALMSGDDLARRADVKSESTIQHQLVLMPETEGVFVVTVGVDTEGKEGLVSRIFSIPVIVAPAGEPNRPPADAAAPANNAGS